METNKGMEILLINQYKNFFDDFEYEKENDFENKSREYMKGRKVQLDIIYENLTDNFFVNNTELENLYEKELKNEL